MKFRTDFVTNSSSSCYVTSYRVQGIPFQPLEDDYMGEVSVSYAYVSIEDVIERIKSGASVDEIVTMFAESTCNRECLEHMFSEGLEYKILNSGLPYEETLEKVRDLEVKDDDPEYDEGNAHMAEVCLDRIRRFRKAMSRFSSASEIKEIKVIETYTGWGEFLSNSIESYIDSLAPEIKELADVLLDDDWWEDMSEAANATCYNVEDGTSHTAGSIDKDEIMQRYWDYFDSCDTDDLEDEIPKLEYIAAKVEGESAIPKIIDTLLNKKAVDYAEQFLDKMTAVGGKHAEVAEHLRAKVADAKEGKGNSKSTISQWKYVDPYPLFLRATLSLATALKTQTACPDGYELLTRAIAAGSAEAVNMQGVLYGGAVKLAEAFGQTVEKDYKKARACFEKALVIKPDLEIAKNNLKKLEDVEEAERVGREPDATLKWIVMQKRQSRNTAGQA